MAHIPLHHKYRPQTFADLVGQEAIATTLTNALRLQKIAPAYLFTGPRGTGKTSSARILAKSLNCMLSQVPTAQPCGSCDVCRSIALGAALDIIEIDAASNTGVDNIREIIERAQYAPVQCRYKVYIIDECLTGDSLVLTSNGWTRIDDRSLLGQKVLSYDDRSCKWEWKKVLRWLDRGKKPTLTIKTTQREISCTGNHLIGTNRGWIKAQDLKPGMKILSPLSQSNSKQQNSAQSVLADVAQNYLFPPICSQEPPFIESSPIGNNILTSKGMVSHTKEAGKTLSLTTSDSTLVPVASGWRTYNPIPSHQWHTSLETIESVNLAGSETVYDLEVEDNHNFVANGLLVHNCHMLTTAAFNSLLKTLEEPPPHVVFILATTDPQRVLPTIISRCQRFDYRRIPVEAMVGHLTYIAQIEQIDIPTASIRTISQIAQGGLRDAESLLDRLSLFEGEITPSKVWDAIGSVPEQDLLEILQSIAANDPETLLTRTTQILERGKEPITVLQNLAGCYRDLLIAKTAPKRSDLVALTTETWTELCKIAQTWQINWILAGQQHLKDSEVQLKHSTQPRLWLEITLFGLLSVRQSPTVPTSGDAPPMLGSAPLTQHLPLTQSPSLPVPHPLPPSPPPPETPPEPLPIATDHTNLITLWGQVLEKLLPSTKSLCGGYGQLASLTEQQAIVTFKPTMKNIAEPKIPELTKVFSDILGRSVVVRLEVTGQISPPTIAPSTLVPIPAPPVAPLITEPIAPREEKHDMAVTIEPMSAFKPTIELPLESVPTIVTEPELLSSPQDLSIEPESLELFPPSDFAEPPDTLDFDRAASIPFNGAEELEPEIDPLVRAATDDVVKKFDGEIIDRTDALFDKIVGDNATVSRI